MRLDRILMAAGMTLLAWCAVVIVDAEQAQKRQRTELNRVLATPETPAGTASASARRVTADKKGVSRGGLIGSLEIPRLRLSAMVVEGDDDQTLRRGIGHLPDTPLPWEKGNSALAGHRDTFLRAMKNINAGDEIRLTTPHGTFTYRVREMAIVKPDNLSGLSRTDDSTLTLITCYPFNFVGNAPKRFVVRAWPIQTPARTARNPNPTSATRPR